MQFILTLTSQQSSNLFSEPCQNTNAENILTSVSFIKDPQGFPDVWLRKRAKYGKSVKTAKAVDAV
jgi:hypothetical protein